MVAILISTYNGANYISPQIESIISQSYKDWVVYIRDDGSSDATKEIIKNYSVRYPNKIIVDEDNNNLGAGKSFMHLLEVTEADYYMFCDQDDVWMSDKIERTLKKAQEMEQTFGKVSPIGVFTDLMVVDQNLNIIMPSLWKGDNRHPEYIHNFYKQWTNRHAAYGCTMLFNRAAKNIMFPFRQFEGVMGAHDTWIEYNLIKRGHWDYLDEPTIYYRQHTSNVIGANMGKTYKDEVNYNVSHPLDLFKKLVKDYKRTKTMPFKIYYPKVLWYHIYQSIRSLFN